MIRYTNIDESGRICVTTEEAEYAGKDSFEFDFPDGFIFSSQHDYRIADDSLIYDPLPNEIEETDYQNQLETATIMFVNESTPNLTDEQALSIPLLFYEWEVGKEYIKDKIIRYNGELYRIGQTHTSQEQWKPGDEETTALYSHIEFAEEGYEVWKEWDGVSGIYAEGQIVEDPNDGKVYKSKIANNVWGPPSQQPSYWEEVSDTNG